MQFIGYRAVPLKYMHDMHAGCRVDEAPLANRHLGPEGRRKVSILIPKSSWNFEARILGLVCYRRSPVFVVCWLVLRSTYARKHRPDGNDQRGSPPNRPVTGSSSTRASTDMPILSVLRL